MIIGEKFVSEFDGYEEDNYDYLFKRKPKAVRQQKRAERKEMHQQKRQDRKAQGKGLPGKKKLPILGNFGMFDKNKKMKETPGTPLPTEPNPEFPSTAETTPLAQANSSDASTELQIPASALPPAPSSDSVRPSASGNAEQKPTEAQSESNTAAPVTSTKPDVTNASSIPASTLARAASAENKTAEKKAGKKEALFSPLVGFACLGVVIILAGYAFFKAQQKSLATIKGTA